MCHASICRTRTKSHVEPHTHSILAFWHLWQPGKEGNKLQLSWGCRDNDGENMSSLKKGTRERRR
jgi:hypothetical protein